MLKISPFLKPFLRLLELPVVAFIVFKVLDYSIEAEKASLPQDWRSQIGVGLMQTILGIIVLLIYFVFWNIRIVTAIKRESQLKAKYLNISLLCLLPGLLVLALIYWQIQKKTVKNKADTYLVPVSYREIFRTPNKLTGIRGFRPSSDSLLILTWRSKVIDPHKTYPNEDEEVRGQSFDQEPIENSEELFSFRNDQLKRVAERHDYLQFREYYFTGRTKCLQAFVNRKTGADIYRFDNCSQQHLLRPSLTGYHPDFRHNTINYEVDRELFFLTSPLHPDNQPNNYFYVGRITDTKARVYRLDLGKDRELVKEFKNSHSTVHLFATNRHVYLISRFRILEISL